MLKYRGISPRQGRHHRRRPGHPRHRGRAAARALVQWATALRYQALFSEAGGIAVGNDVTVSGIKVGSVSSIKLDNGDALVGFTINGKYALGTDTTAHIRTGTLLGERVLALESAGSGHAVSQFGHPDLADVVAVLADRRGQRTDQQYRGHRHRIAQPVAGHAGADARPDRPAAGPDVRRCLAAVEVAEQSQREPGGAAEDRGRRHRDPVRAKRAGQRADPQRQRSARRAQRAPVRDHQPACQHVGGVRSSSPALVADNEKELAPTLEKLNDVTAMLEKNRDNLAKMLPGAAKYYLTQGEIVANGAYYNALVPNLVFGTDPAAVPGLRVRIPSRRQRGPAAGQRRPAGGTSVPRQQHSAARRPPKRWRPR